LKKIAIYIHWPFCLSKCPYCDFNSHVSDSIDIEAWEEAYMKEIESYSHKIQNRNISSIFFGGGTPSLMPAKLVEKIINKLASFGKITTETEITLEANPTSVEAQKFIDFKSAAINRISIGVQSLRAGDLKFLGREHNVTEAISAIELARKTFDRYSFDLIYARPGQSLKAWQEELKDTMKIAGGHISLYQLTIEKGTPFFKKHSTGDFILPDNDVAADMYNFTNEHLSDNGYNLYEISNYAKKGEECRHNLSYWHYDEYIGIGPGAHSRIQDNGVKAVMNIHAPSKWLEAVKMNGSGIQKNEPLTKQEITEEILMMGLRLKAGINDKRLCELTHSLFKDVINQDNLKQYIELGFVDFTNNHLKLTDKGLLMHSYIVPRLMTN
jgi:putative oxygen-independent coproporphyrinogen III oxidase